MKTPISLAVAAFMFGIGGLSAQASAITLEEALAAAYVSNPTLEAERARVRGVDEQVPQALSGWRPTVKLTGDIGQQRVESSGGSIVGTRTVSTNPKGVGVSLNQPLFNGFQTTNAIAAAEDSVLAARSQLTATEQQVLLDGAQVYMDVLRDMALVALNVNNEQVLSRQLEATQDRFNVGEITRTDVSQAESRLAGAVASRIAAEGQLRSSQASFERVIGLPASGLEVPSQMDDMLPKSLDDSVQSAISNQPSVQAAEYAANASLKQVDVVRGELMPAVNLQAGVSKDWENTASNSEQETAAVMANVTIPLYQSGAVYSRMRAAKHTAGQRRIEVDLARNSARESAVQSWETVQAARARIVSIKAQVQAAEIALDGVQREAQVGARTVLDVLDAEQELLDARVSLVGAERDERVAAHQLLAATGRLTARDMGLGVDVYDPTTHYEDVRNQWFGSSASAEADASRPVR